MRLPRARITVRRLILAVAALAVVMWAAVVNRRAASYRDLAERHSRLEAVYCAELGAETEEHLSQRIEQVRRDGDRGWFHMLPIPLGPERDAEVAKLERRLRRLPGLRERITYHGRLAARYERACSALWRTVPPDPPEPAWPD